MIVPTYKILTRKAINEQLWSKKWYDTKGCAQPVTGRSTETNIGSTTDGISIERIAESVKGRRIGRGRQKEANLHAHIENGFMTPS